MWRESVAPVAWKRSQGAFGADPFKRIHKHDVAPRPLAFALALALLWLVPMRAKFTDLVT